MGITALTGRVLRGVLTMLVWLSVMCCAVTYWPTGRPACSLIVPHLLRCSPLIDQGCQGLLVSWPACCLARLALARLALIVASRLALARAQGRLGRTTALLGRSEAWPGGNSSSSSARASASGRTISGPSSSGCAPHGPGLQVGATQ